MKKSRLVKSQKEELNTKIENQESFKDSIKKKGNTIIVVNNTTIIHNTSIVKIVKPFDLLKCGSCIIGFVKLLKEYIYTKY